MKRTKIGERFFSSTRGRIVLLLRSSKRTVRELSEELGVTDNAVRSNLLSLERDGFVRQAGMAKGVRKPHFTYSLTEEAGKLFPKGYDSLLIHLLDTLKRRLGPEDLALALAESGRELGSEYGRSGPDLKEAVSRTVEALESLGGIVNVETGPEGFRIDSKGCPFSKTVVSHPELCKVVESMLSEITGADVREICDRNGLPSCSFFVNP